MTTTPLLKYYNPEEELTIQCDASEKGLRAALLQKGQPVAFASCALTDTEKGNVISSVCAPQVRLVCLWEKSDYRE